MSHFILYSVSVLIFSHVFIMSTPILSHVFIPMSTHIFSYVFIPMSTPIFVPSSSESTSAHPSLISFCDGRTQNGIHNSIWPHKEHSGAPGCCLRRLCWLSSSAAGSTFGLKFEAFGSSLGDEIEGIRLQCDEIEGTWLQCDKIEEGTWLQYCVTE